MTFFNASQVKPEMGAQTHPPGQFPHFISNRQRKPASKAGHEFLEIEFTTPSGTATARFNLWNSNQQAVNIAAKELSALCHSVGVYQLENDAGPNIAHELQNAQGQIVIAPQTSGEGKDKGYTEIIAFLTRDGRDPTKNNAAPQGGQPTGNAPPYNPPPQQQQQPPAQQQQAQGGWQGANTTQQPPAQQQQGQNWQQSGNSGGNNWQQNQGQQPPAQATGNAPWKS